MTGATVLLIVLGLSIFLGKMPPSSERADANHELEIVSGNAPRVLAEGLYQRLTIVQSLAASEALWGEGLASNQVSAALEQQQLVRSILAWPGVADVRGVVCAATGEFPRVGNVTISCGVSRIQIGEEGFAALGRADRALCKTKSEGRNRAVLLETSVETA